MWSSNYQCSNMLVFRGVIWIEKKGIILFSRYGDSPLQKQRFSNLEKTCATGDEWTFCRNMLPPRKTNMTGWKIHHEWRCISYWNMGIFQPVMLVFSGFNVWNNHLVSPSYQGSRTPISSVKPSMINLVATPTFFHLKGWQLSRPIE